MYYVLLILSLAILNSCSPFGETNNEKRINISNFYINDAGDLEIEFTKSKTAVRRASLLEGKWISSDNKETTLNKDSISYQENTVIVKNNGKIIFKDDNLPTIKVIEEAIDILLPNARIYYIPFRVEKYFTWDKKTHIAFIRTDIEQKVTDLNRYSFALIKQEDRYSIQKMDKIVFGQITSANIAYINDINDKITRLSLSSKASFCNIDSNFIVYRPTNYAQLLEIECFVREDNTIVAKKLFGDLYPIEYYTGITNRYEEIQNTPAEQYFFDEEDNMHLFYTKEAHIGEYYNYEMYTPDEPLVPKYEQKIYWR